MELDPDIHIVMHSVLSLKTGCDTKIIIACMALHNFIRESTIADADFERCDNDENYMPLASVSSSQQNGDEEQDMNDFRDSIANALFNMRG
jgi:hypothetical protein